MTIVSHHFDAIVAPDFVMTEPRLRDDQATIARQLSHDRTSIVVHDLSPSSRPMKIVQLLTIARSMRIGCSLCVHESTSESFDRRHLSWI